MKTWIGLIVLLVVYAALLLGEGMVYDATMELFRWLDGEHDRKSYVGWISLILIIVAYLLFLERDDKDKEELEISNLVEKIKNQGIVRTKKENKGYGDVIVEARITFRDAGFEYQIGQYTSNGTRNALLNRKFLTWKDLAAFIKQDGMFTMNDFLEDDKHLNRS